MIHFVITLPVFASLSYFSGSARPGHAWIIGVPILLLAQAALTLAGVIIISTVNAFFRDLEQLLRVLLLLLFYLTPVLYPVSMVPNNLSWLLFVNPFSPLIISWRALLMENTLSPYVFVSTGYAILSLLIAFPVYRNMEWKLPEVV
jgi:lipopolysaccharide transport system permease protein